MKLQEIGKPIQGEVHHVANCHYIITNTRQLNTRLRDFPEGAKVEVYIKAREDFTCEGKSENPRKITLKTGGRH